MKKLEDVLFNLFCVVKMVVVSPLLLLINNYIKITLIYIAMYIIKPKLIHIMFFSHIIATYLSTDSFTLHFSNNNHVNVCMNQHASI